MPYVFRGGICGSLCKDCVEFFPKAELWLYNLSDDSNPGPFIAANPKFTLRELDQTERQRREGDLLAQTPIEPNGTFAVELPDGYDGQAFETHVVIYQLPGSETPLEEPLHINITALQPEWRDRDNYLVAGWEYCFPTRYWCALRERLGRYVICGRVIDCEDQQNTPIPGVQVEAFDRDWLQDDALGSDVTDANGEFRIYYTAADFRPGTFIDIELFGGPDVYFRVETALGSPVLIEDPSRGRDPDRENVGACFCVTLCAEEAPPTIEPAPFFTHLGAFEYDTDIDSGIAGSGLTIASNRAFFSNVRLNGVMAKTLNGSPTEYRFEYRERTAAGAFVGAWQQVSAGQIAKTKIGVLERANPNYPATSPNPIEVVDYVIGAAQPDELAATISGDVHGDWVQVPQQASSPLSGVGFFIPNGDMIRLETATIGSFSDVDLTGLLTGASTTTVQPLVANRFFALRMIIREVGDLGPGMQAGICDKVAVNNVRYDNINSHPAWAGSPLSNRLGVSMVNIAQLTAPGTGCTGITTALDVTFTAAHPTLGTVNLSMVGPGGPYSFTLPAAVAGEHFGTATNNFVVADLDPCAYIVSLSVQVLLTTGDSSPNDLVDQIAFCKS